MNILLLEDDQKTGSFIVRGFRELGHVADWSPDGRAGLAKALKARHPGLCVEIAFTRAEPAA